MPISSRLTVRVEQYNSSFGHHFGWLLPKALLQDALLVFHPSGMHLFAMPTSLVIQFSFHGVHAVSVVSAIDGDLSSVYFLFGSKLYDKPLLRQTVYLHALLTV